MLRFMGSLEERMNLTWRREEEVSRCKLANEDERVEDGGQCSDFQFGRF